MFQLRALLFSLAVLAAGCTPVLSNPPVVDDDDDTTAGDDDDTTADDDDDTTADDDDDDDSTWGDDDDIVDPSCSSQGTTSSWVTGPSDVSGTWVPGTIALDETTESLQLMTDAGVGYTWRVGASYPLLLDLAGQGRVYWSQPGFGAWGGDFVFAVESWDTGYRFVTALVVGQGEVLIDDWAALFTAQSWPCDGVLIDDACGLLQAVAIEYEVPTWDGMAIGTLFPGEAVASTDLYVAAHWGAEYVALECDDVDILSWSFTMQSVQPWDG